MRGNKMDINLFHGLEGDSIYFQALNAKDAEEIHAYASDEEVSRFIGWRLMNTLAETTDYIDEMLRREAAGTHLYASIVLRATGTIIGTVMIFNFDREANHAEIGYVLHKDYWGKGYCTETIKLINEFAFDKLKLHKLHARVVDKNIGSIRVLEKNAYQLEGHVKDYYYIDGSYYDMLLFGRFSFK